MSERCARCTRRWQRRGNGPAITLALGAQRERCDVHHEGVNVARDAAERCWEGVKTSSGSALVKRRPRESVVRLTVQKTRGDTRGGVGEGSTRKLLTEEKSRTLLAA